MGIIYFEGLYYGIFYTYTNTFIAVNLFVYVLLFHAEDQCFKKTKCNTSYAEQAVESKNK